MITQRSVWMRTLLPTWIFLFNAILFAQTNSLSLEIGQPQKRELTGGRQHAYQLAMTSGQYGHLIVTQLGIDIAVTVLSPDGKILVEVDEFDETNESESVCWIAESAGLYRIEIYPTEKNAATGQYEIKLTELRSATQQDRKRVTAEQTFAAGGKLFDEGTAASYRLARPQFETAILLFREMGEREREASACFLLGLTENSLNEKARALPHFQTAQRLRHDLQDRAGEAAAWQNLGTIHNDLGDRRKALDAYLQALPLRREAKDRSGEAITLNGLGNVYRDLGERRKALEYYLQSLPIRREIKDRNGEAITLNNLGVIYDDLGEVQKMLDVYQQALPLRRDARGRAITLNNIGRAYDRLGLSEEALSYFNQALPLARQIADKLIEARALNFMGLAYSALGDYQKAQAHLKAALPLYREVKNRAGEASTLHNLGLIHDALSQPQQALEVYQQALLISREAKNQQYEAYISNELGFVYDRLGNKSEAMKSQRHALELSLVIGDARRVAKSRYGIARIERESGKLEAAKEQIRQAIETTETIRAKLDNPELRASYRASTGQYYEFYIDLLMQMRKKPSGARDFATLAFQVNEQARARSLLEMLLNADAEIQPDSPSQTVSRERELQLQLTDKVAQQLTMLAGSSTSEQATAVAAEVDAIKRELRTVQAAVQRDNPRYSTLILPQPMSVADLQRQLLDSNTMVLEYSLGEERSYLWAISAHSLHSYELPGRAKIEPLAKRFYELLTDPSQQKSERRTNRSLTISNPETYHFREAASALSQILLGPVANQLGRKRLLIVADGALQYVPFAALPAPKDERGRRMKDEKKPHPLIVDHEIINLPSASTFALQRKLLEARSPAPKTILVLADPVFDPQDERVQIAKSNSSAKKNESLAAATRGLQIKLKQAATESGFSAGTLNVPRLPGTRREAENILALVAGQEQMRALDFQASRQTIVNDELRQYRYLHFATHGFLNSLHPELSGIVLSLVNENGESQTDGFLLAHEVYNLKLQADLVTLSACQTGLGKEVRGEGIVGMTRGLMYAGAARVVVSLWNVDDDATAALMERFYRGILKNGLRPAAALRAAQIALWKQQQWKAPYFWAAFGLQGEWR
ncbi:MAG: CHAT domain-containing protein [Acidobacteria bacterium]|nr:CHAT domain-containing protein [Acidobacteriota bacterium]